MLKTIVDSDFLLDGGAMHGIVPRVLWSQHYPPDDRGRIQMVSRVTVFMEEAQGRVWLIEAGLGDGWDEKQIDIYGIAQVGGGIEQQLAGLGIAAADVTDIVLTHLHFDHCAGVVRHGQKCCELRFPKAQVYVQKRQLQWALAPSLKDAGSYRKADIECIASAANLTLLEGGGDLSESVAVDIWDGHTEAMQSVRIREAGTTFAVAADLIPLFTHVRLPWIMAYDNHPLLTLEEKERFLRAAAQGEWVVISVHDFTTAGSRISEVGEGRFQCSEMHNLDLVHPASC